MATEEREGLHWYFLQDLDRIQEPMRSLAMQHAVQLNCFWYSEYHTLLHDYLVLFAVSGWTSTKMDRCRLKPEVVDQAQTWLWTAYPDQAAKLRHSASYINSGRDPTWSDSFDAPEASPVARIFAPGVCSPGITAARPDAAAVAQTAAGRT